MKKKILVTGGTGYIGSHTTVELINSGFEVVIIDNLSNSEKSVLNGIQNITGILPTFYQFDICNKNKCNDFFKEHNDLNGIIHFAAYKAVGESVEQPLLYYQNNLVSLINILNAMQEFNINNLVFSSSCTVYGQPDELPVSENAEIKKAESPYGNTKQIAEEIITDFIKANPIYKSILLRYFNPIGAHKSSEIGELPLGIPNNLVPFITQTAAGIRDELKVFGNDYNTNDGTAIRDYIHVVDLAQAHIAALNRLTHNENTDAIEIFNLGTGKGVSVLEAIKSFEKVSKQKLNYSYAPRRKGDTVKVWANTDLANNKLKWKAKLSLDDCMLSAWNWEKKIRNIN